MASAMRYPKPWDAMVESFGDLTKSKELDDFNRQDQLRAGAFARGQMGQQLALNAEFQPQYMEAEQKGISGKLRSIIDLIQRFAGPLREADERANPERTAMRKELGAQRMSDLQAQGFLTPEQLRQQEQDVRRGQQARGLTQGSGPMSDEIRRTTEKRESVRSKSQLAAGQFLSNQSQTPVNTTAMVSGQGGQTPNILSPPSSSRMSAADLYPGLAESTFATNTAQAIHGYNVKQGNAAAKAARMKALWSMIPMVGQATSGAVGTGNFGQINNSGGGMTSNIGTGTGGSGIGGGGKDMASWMSFFGGVG